MAKQDLKKVKSTPPALAKGAKLAKVEDDIKNFSPQEKEIIRRNRERADTVNACKDKIDALLTEYKCILKINPNSPIGAPQIVVDIS